MSVMNGFREQLVDSLSGVNGDITIYDANKDKIKKIQEKNPSISFVCLLYTSDAADES